MNSPKFQFEYVDGPVGSFKTTSLLNYLRNNPIPATICTQTNNLSGQYETAEGLDIEMISREVRKDGDYTAASQTYRERLQSSPARIYAVNQQVAIACQDADPDRFHFFDEIPVVFETFKFNSLPLSQDFVSGWLASALSDEPSYYEMVATDFIRNIAEHGWQDDVLKDCEDILIVAQRIASPHYRVFVHAKSFNAFKNGIPKQLQFFVAARPSLFPKHSVFMGANYKKSLQYLIWSVSEDVEFVPHPEIKAKHADLSHKAAMTEIYYVSERNFSKALFNEKTPGIQKPVKATSFPKIAKATGKAIAEQFPRVKFIYCSNSEYERTKWAGPLGTLVSSNSRGWNGGRDFNMAVFMAAINYDPATITFLRKVFGINKEAAKYALTFESAYQFAGRTSLRMKDSNERVILIFGDRATAKAMQTFIPGSAEPELIDLGIPELLFPDDEPETDDEGEVEGKQTEASVQPVKIEKTADELREANNVHSQLRNRRKRILKNHAETLQYEGFRFRFWAHRSAVITEETDVLDWETILEYFRTYVNREEIPEKDANKMFREGVFFDNENHLLKDNIRSTKIVVLDIDNVTGDVKELSAYLKSRKISHLVVSTYSCLNVENYSERQMKIRVLIPLTEAVDAENYSRIIRLLNRDIREKFPKDEFGSQFPVDPACMSINNRFYAPCRPAKGEPVFIDGTYYDFDITRFVKKAPVFLDARWCMCRNLPEDLEAPVIKRHIASSVRKTADEIVFECAAMAGAGNGDGPFYNAAVELIKAGYSKEEAIAALSGKEHMFGSGNGRNAERAVTHVVDKQRSRAA
ncbi:hypothetical protein I6F11_06005 [Ensifer sp. NBAIM29]|nr:hypothetical protein [Ensifer sp. NBAIM29]